MEKHLVKKQQAEALFRDTFADTIRSVGMENVYFVGKKMYIRANRVIVSVEFSGTATAFNTIVLTAMCINGVIDQNITPLSMLFKDSKGVDGQEKIVTLRVILNLTGEYTFVWTEDLNDGDKFALNNCLMSYVELFSDL